MRKPDLLADLVYAETFARKPFGGKSTNASTAVALAQRQRVKQAQRFVLDDEATRLIVKLEYDKYSSPDAFAGWATLARLPHDVMWIEYNGKAEDAAVEREELERLKRHRPPDLVTASRVGFLLFRDEPGSSRWVAHEFALINDEVRASGFAYVLDPDSDGQSPLRGSETWKSSTLSLRGFPQKVFKSPEDGAVMMVDVEALALGVFVTDPQDPMKFGCPPSFVNRMAIIIEPWLEAIFGFDRARRYAMDEHRGHVLGKIVTSSSPSTLYRKGLVSSLRSQASAQSA